MNRIVNQILKITEEIELKVFLFFLLIFVLSIEKI